MLNNSESAISLNQDNLCLTLQNIQLLFKFNGFEVCINHVGSYHSNFLKSQMIEIHLWKLEII